jgi:hypothetical protein
MGTDVQEAEIDVGLANGDEGLWDFFQEMELKNVRVESARQQNYLIRDVRPVLNMLRALRLLTQRDVSRPVPIIKRSGGQWSLKDGGEDTLYLR